MEHALLLLFIQEASVWKSVDMKRLQLRHAHLKKTAWRDVRDVKETPSSSRDVIV